MTVLTGNKGKLKVGYQVAATLCQWTVTRQQVTLGSPDVVLVGTISTVNRFWTHQQPMIVGLWMGDAWWVWHTLTDIDGIDEGTITAQLIGNPVAVQEF